MSAEIICYGQHRFGDHVQEWYESASNHTRRRARELRNAGLRVFCCDSGTLPQRDGSMKVR